MAVRLLCIAAMALAGSLFCPIVHADPATPPWRIIWFPPGDTLSSWNWADHDGIVPFDDPAKKVAIPLDNPEAGGELDFHTWQPGGSWTPQTRDPKLAQLEALGEGTFLCAILGDGKRYSNVAKVTIRRSFNPAHEPVLRLTAIQPYGKDDPIKYIGAWIVAPTPADSHLTSTALHCPALEVDGKWRFDFGDMNGMVCQLGAGTNVGEVYYVTFQADHPKALSSLAGMGAYNPPIQPFIRAKVRLKISDRLNYDEDPHLTPKIKQALESITPPDSHPFQTYVSDTFTLQVDKDAMTRFEKAFGESK